MIEWPWPAPEDDGGAAHLVAGLAMPDLPLPSTIETSISLARQPGRCVVVIYPWTGGPDRDNPEGWDTIPGAHGSTPELEGFARLHHGFRDVATELVGLSAQPLHEQQEFAQRLDLPFPLVSDVDGGFSRSLRLPTFKANNGHTFLKRLTLVLRDGRIEQVYYPVHPPDTHSREVMYLCGATRPGAHTGR